MSRESPSIARLLLSDGRLARLAASGDERAFEAIFRRHQQDIYRFCLAMSGDPQDAQRATQATMARVRRALPDKHRQTRLRPWLYRIAREEVATVCPDRHGTVAAQSAESRAATRRLLSDLERLPQRQRAVLVMRELSGLDFAQIGAAFETTPGEAREALYEARLQLQAAGQGREARCLETMRCLSNADGRAPWRLKVHLHLRHCPDCRAFRDEIGTRRNGLTVLAPLPLAAGASAFAKASAAAAVVVAVAGLSATERAERFGSDPRQADGGAVVDPPAAALPRSAAPLATTVGADETSAPARATAAGHAMVGIGAPPDTSLAAVDPVAAQPVHATQTAPPSALGDGPAAIGTSGAPPSPGPISPGQSAGEDHDAIPSFEPVAEIELVDEDVTLEPEIELAAESGGEASVLLPAPSPAAEPPAAEPSWEHRDRPGRGRRGRGRR